MWTPVALRLILVCITWLMRPQPVFNHFSFCCFSLYLPPPTLNFLLARHTQLLIGVQTYPAAFSWPSSSHEVLSFSLSLVVQLDTPLGFQGPEGECSVLGSIPWLLSANHHSLYIRRWHQMSHVFLSPIHPTVPGSLKAGTMSYLSW